MATRWEKKQSNILDDIKAGAKAIREKSGCYPKYVYHGGKQYTHKEFRELLEKHYPIKAQ